jgi:hypothetical protein
MALMEEKDQAAKEDFDRLAQEYLHASLEIHPTRATAQGYHRHDERLEDFSEAGIRRAVRTYHDYLARMEQLDASQLDLSRRIDHRLLANDIRSALFELEELQSYRHDPTVYNDILGFSTLFLTLLPEGAPEWRERLRSLGRRLEAFPELLAAARTHLAGVSPVLIDYVIDANRANLHFLEERAPALWRHAPEQKSGLENACRRALNAVRSYQKWLEEELPRRGPGEWRLGRRMWERKLRFTLQSDLSPEEIERRAIERIREERLAMLELAEPLHQRFFPSHEHRERGEDRIPIVGGRAHPEDQGLPAQDRLHHVASGGRWPGGGAHAGLPGRPGGGVLQPATGLRASLEEIVLDLLRGGEARRFRRVVSARVQRLRHAEPHHPRGLPRALRAVLACPQLTGGLHL